MPAVIFYICSCMGVTSTARDIFERPRLGLCRSQRPPTIKDRTDKHHGLERLLEVRTKVRIALGTGGECDHSFAPWTVELGGKSQRCNDFGSYGWKRCGERVDFMPG